MSFVRCSLVCSVVLVLLTGCPLTHSSDGDGGAGGDASADGGRAVEFVQVSVYRDTSCALRSDGVAACWGYAFPDGPLIREGPFDQVAAGQNQACLLRDGEVECIPAPFAAEHDMHGDVPPGSYRYVDTATAWTCALQRDRTPRCWGSSSGEPPRAPEQPLTTLDVGARWACGLTAEQRPVCWAPACCIEPVDVPADALVAMAPTQFSICGIKPDGNARCWTDDATARELFGRPPEGPFESLSVSQGASACALRPGGEAVCWGDDYDVGRLEPEGLRYRQLSLGFAHACGITREGELVCWGSNDWDQANPPELPPP